MPKGDSNTCRSKDDTSCTGAEMAEDYCQEQHSNCDKNIYYAEVVDITENYYKAFAKKKKSKSANDSDFLGCGLLNLRSNVESIESMAHSTQNKIDDFSEGGLCSHERALLQAEDMVNKSKKRKSKSKHKQSTDTWKSDIDFGASSSSCPSSCMTETQGTERKVNLGTELWDKKNQSTTIWK